MPYISLLIKQPISRKNLNKNSFKKKNHYHCNAIPHKAFVTFKLDPSDHKPSCIYSICLERKKRDENHKCWQSLHSSFHLGALGLSLFLDLAHCHMSYSSPKPSFPVFHHQCSLPTTEYPDMLLWRLSLKNRNKNSLSAHIPL